MCSSIVFVPNEMCNTAALFVIITKDICCAAVPSFILLHAILLTTAYEYVASIAQKHVLKTIQTTKMVSSENLYQIKLLLFEKMTVQFR